MVQRRVFQLINELVLSTESHTLADHKDQLSYANIRNLVRHAGVEPPDARRFPPPSNDERPASQLLAARSRLTRIGNACGADNFTIPGFEQHHQMLAGDGIGTQR